MNSKITNEQRQVQQKIKSLAASCGATFTGFSCVREGLSDALSDYPYAVSYGIRLSDAIINEIDASKPTFTYFHHYRTSNFLLDQIGLRIMLYLIENGNKAYQIAASQSYPEAEKPYSGVFPHKTAAVLANMGSIGKNGLFLHHAYGPRVRLGTVLTDLPLFADRHTPIQPCRNCRACIDACPASALLNPEKLEGCDRDQIVDAQACSKYMNQRYKHIGRGSVCGICIRVCPHGSANTFR